MTIDEQILERAVAMWGHDKQMEMLEEEAIELALATHKYLRGGGKTRLDDLIGEVADVHIMLRYINLMFPNSKERIQEVIDFKLKRLKGRLDQKSFE